MNQKIMRIIESKKEVRRRGREVEQENDRLDEVLETENRNENKSNTVILSIKLKTTMMIKPFQM